MAKAYHTPAKLFFLNPRISPCAGVTDVTWAVNSVQAASRHTERST